jgi:hypothetical protein
VAGVDAGRARVAAIVAAAVVAGVTGVAATASFTPAWSYVPVGLRAKLAAESGGVLYLPARTPLFYRYRSGAKVSGGILSATFTNRLRVRKGLWRWTKQTFLWQVRPLASAVSCPDWAGSQRTFQVDGNKVYWSTAATGDLTWRCVTDRRGKRHVLVATQGGKLPGVGLATVVASGLDVSGRR